MTDIVERLHRMSEAMALPSHLLMRDAANEIERLRHEEMRLRTALDYHVNELREARRDIDRLRGAA